MKKRLQTGAFLYNIPKGICILYNGVFRFFFFYFESGKSTLIYIYICARIKKKKKKNCSFDSDTFSVVSSARAKNIV